MQNLFSLYSGDPRLGNAIQKLENSGSYDFSPTNTSFDSIFIAHTAQKIGGTHIVVSANNESAEALFHDISALKPQITLHFFEAALQIKNKTLYKPSARFNLQNLVIDSIEEHKDNLIITYPQAILEKFLVTKDVSHILKLKLGDKLSISSLIEYLETNGYEREQFVYEYGQYAIRGNIIDIFSYAYKNPIRIELFDIEIEAIRFFDIEAQLSTENIDIAHVSMNPKLRNSRAFAVRSILDYTDGNTLWSPEVNTLKKLLNVELDYLLGLNNELNTEIETDLLQKATINTIFKQKNHIRFNAIGENLNIELHPAIHKNFNKLYQTVEESEKKGYRVSIMSDDPIQEERYRQIFTDLGGERRFTHIQDELTHGFIDHEKKIVLLTTHEIFSKRLFRQSGQQVNVSAQAQLLKSLRELVPGDYVTHLDHGVGRFSGLEKIEHNGHFQEAVRLIYANNDILYVHINSLHKISKYVGKDGTEPKMHRLGSDTWENLKRKTKKKIKDIAEDLIKLYAKRKATIGFSFSPDTYLQFELETAFEYEDTPDQTKATQEVKADMEKEIPMDRLICGDVGFGKTEVAVRAAFKAVSDSKQVAVLVPTTLLAFQHYHTFKKRMEDFPVNIEFINRFKTTKQKSEIYKKLQDGKIDILIGTHALVSKNVKFKDLGLLIVDEEQKFGVVIKEKLKEFKLNVDTLTMTATPIPRTLQFSLLGARDYTLIQTPPPSRQSVYTEVTQFDPDYIKEIIQNEVGRGGQVFFVHNKVKDLYQLKEMLHKILPTMDIAIAHGQLEGDAIEQIIIDFIDKKYDILLCTNIIESGIDISNVNTILINNAHQFGLSDLHQLRGRVGRSHRKAYCYLLSPGYSSLTKEAKQRLQAMEQNAELGSGFQIAMRDLDLRGAGNLLGGEQSGFISDIGYDTFMKILDEAIIELKEGDYKELYQNETTSDQKEEKDYVRECQIETDYDMYIPDKFISGSQERLNVYTELNQLKSEKALLEYLGKLKDIYGKLPNQIKDICDAIRLKWKASKLGIERISIKNNRMKCYLIQNQDHSFYQSDTFGKIINYIAEYPGGTSMKQTSQFIIIEFNGLRNCIQAKEKLEHVLSYCSAP